MTSASHGFRVLAVAVLAPLVITIAGVGVTIALAASGPSTVATHWGISGEPDRFGSPYSYAILIAAVTVAIIGFIGGSTVLFAHRSPMTPMIKILGVSSGWVSVLLVVGIVGALLGQRTVASVHSASTPWLELIVGAVVATAAAFGGWFILPKAVRLVDDLSQVPPVALAEGERASWIRTATASRGVLWLFAAVAVVLGCAEVLVVVATGGQFWWFTFIPIVVVALVLSNLAWTVRVDARGVRVRSVLAFPSISIPLGNIESATVTAVDAFAQYGGWGIRWNFNGRLGVILRSGEALEIRRRKGLAVVVTVDDATSAAALINALIRRPLAAP